LLLWFGTHLTLKLMPRFFSWRSVSIKQNSRARRVCPEVLEEDREGALLDYSDAAEFTSNGKYRCRDCGQLFETIEAHDRHHSRVHSQAETILNQGMTM
jgi:hypothetical protein